MQNTRRRLKSDLPAMEYDFSSPIAPTLEQVNLCGQILSNSIAAMFAQQSPPTELSYVFMMADELTMYTKPIIDYTMHCFRTECGFNFYGNVNVSKASANKALKSLEKILFLNDHHQIVFDLRVWDLFNPPTLVQLKKLAIHYPYQPLSDMIQKNIVRCQEEIYKRIEGILYCRFNNPQWGEGIRDNITDIPWVENRPKRYEHGRDERFLKVENNHHVNVSPVLFIQKKTTGGTKSR